MNKNLNFTKKSVLIAGNGPSLKEIDYSLLPKNMIYSVAIIFTQKINIIQEKK